MAAGAAGAPMAGERGPARMAHNRFGCGISSVVFILRGSEHTMISPNVDEHQRARQWCAERGFSTDCATSIIDDSTIVLPALDGQYDLALIDGGHVFPVRSSTGYTWPGSFPSTVCWSSTTSSCQRAGSCMSSSSPRAALGRLCASSARPACSARLATGSSRGPIGRVSHGFSPRFRAETRSGPRSIARSTIRAGSGRWSRIPDVSRARSRLLDVADEPVTWGPGR